MADKSVTISVDDGVADIRLNRPDKLNALDVDMLEAIVDIGESLKQDRSTRVVVLSGEGRGFCAGIDFGTFQAMAAGDGGPTLRRIGDTSGRTTHLGQQAAHVWFELECPVIAAVHGVALGGGLQIALAADIRIVTPDARLSVLEIQWGLVPDMTGTAMLPLLVGLDVAKELTFTGRTVLGEEAVRLGLATRSTPTPLEDALALAHEIAGKSPKAVRGSKTLLNRAPFAPFAEQFRDEREIIRPLLGSKNMLEATMAYLDKRDPQFDD